MADRDSRFLLKRSNVSDKIPTTVQLTLGEVGLNTADAKLYTSYTGGLTGATEVRAIGWDRLSTVSGGTVNGDLTVNGDTNFSNFSATTANLGYIDFDTTFTGATIEGRLHWGIDDGTLSLGMEGGNVAQQIGEEMYYHIKNQSGATIEKGRVVKEVGTVGASGKLLGEYMIADGSVATRFTLGIANEDIANGSDGFVTEFGLVKGIDATGTPYGETWNDGDVLYVSSTIEGGLTKVQPSTPNLHIEMGLVVHSASNGVIFVRPHRYAHLHDLQELIWSEGDETNLDIIQWDSSLSGFTLTNTPIFNSISATTISGGTFYGDGSNLTGLDSGTSLVDTITANENLVSGDLVYLDTSGRYSKADRFSETTSSTELRIVTETITSGSTGSALVQGRYTTTGLTQGSPYWVDISGTYVDTQSNNDGDIVRYIGTALSSTVLEFNPDELYIEISATPGSGTNPQLKNVTTSGNILSTDYTVNVTTTGDTTQTLPTAVGRIGKVYNIKNSDSTGVSTITLDTSSSQLIDTLYTSVAGGNPITFTYPTNLTLQSNGIGWILI